MYNARRPKDQRTRLGLAHQRPRRLATMTPKDTRGSADRNRDVGSSRKQNGQTKTQTITLRKDLFTDSKCHSCAVVPRKCWCAKNFFVVAHEGGEIVARPHYHRSSTGAALPPFEAQGHEHVTLQSLRVAAPRPGRLENACRRGLRCSGLGFRLSGFWVWVLG